MQKPDAWHPILEAARQGDVILLYSARDTEHNSALVLKSLLAEQYEEMRRDSASFS